jgi:hypothetical protein
MAKKRLPTSIPWSSTKRTSCRSDIMQTRISRPSPCGRGGNPIGSRISLKEESTSDWLYTPGSTNAASSKSGAAVQFLLRSLWRHSYATSFGTIARPILPQGNNRSQPNFPFYLRLASSFPTLWIPSLSFLLLALVCLSVSIVPPSS